MRNEWMIVLVMAVMLAVPVAADSQAWTIGPTEISLEMEHTYNETDSQDLRRMIDEFVGNNDSTVNQTELDDYLAMMDEFEAFELNWTVDGAMNTSSSASFSFDGVLGDVNGTTLITETMTMAWTYATTTADEHTIVIPYEGEGGEDNETVDVTLKTESGWYFESVSATGLTISSDGTEIETDTSAMDDITEDVTIVITNQASDGNGDGDGDGDGEDDDDDDDGAPGFEMVAVVGAMAVALIAVRRRR